MAHMDSSKKIVLLNAGTETRKAFIRGIGDTPYEWYHTKRMMLHIKDMVPTFLYKGAPIDWSGATVFTRLRGEDQQFSGMLYDFFTHNGISANDAINSSYENSSEKIAQMLTLTLAGIRVPESFIFREESFKRHRAYILKRLAFPFIFKTDGSRGRNVVLISSEAEFITAMATKPQYARALVQPFIPNTFDTRTLVAYGEILGSIKRTRTSGFLNNIAQGAIPEVYTLTVEERDIARRAAQVCGTDFAGVDFIHTPDGPIVLEVNKSPQIHGFESVHNFKVFEKIGEIVKRKMHNQ